MLEDEDGDVVVVVGGDAGRADQAVADDLRGAGRAGESGFERGDALVQVGVAALHQPVGVEDGGGAGAEGDGAGGVDPAAGAERRAGGFVGAGDRAVLVADQDRQVAGGGVHQAALVGVVDGVDAGGDLVGVDLGGEAVEELEHLVRGQVETGVGADGGAELAHDGGGPHPAAHDVADDQGGAAAAEGDHVVPVAADRGLGAAGLVGGGDAQVVGLFQFLWEQGALEGDGGLALAALAGAQPFGGLGVVGDVRGEHENGAAAGVVVAVLGDGGAGEGVRAAVDGLAGLQGAGLAAAQHLVEEREQAQLGEFGQGLAGGGAGGAGAEGRRVGVVDVGDAVVGAVDEGDEGRDAVQDVTRGQFVDGGHRGCAVGGLFGAGRGHGALPVSPGRPPSRSARRRGAAFRGAGRSSA